jgi:cell wall-associated NlpC family hydrolase
MPLLDPSARRSLGATLAGTLLCLAAHAAPQTGADPLAQLLGERGLAPAFVANPNPGPVVSPATPASVALSAAVHPSFVEQFRDSASGMVVSAMNFLGVRYVRGGNSVEEGFDCSGFTRYVFEHSLGLVLPRRADEQAAAPGLVQVKRDDLQPGDLVFFNTLRRTFSHVGIYVGENKFIHAPRSGSNVRVESMGTRYWSKRFTGARRPADASLVASAAKVPHSAAPAPVAAPMVAAPAPAPRSNNIPPGDTAFN